MATRGFLANVHRLSGTLALGAGGVCALVLLVLSFLGASLPLWSAMLGIVLVSLGVYGVAELLLKRRIAEARATVKQIRRGAFDGSSGSNTRRTRDELGALVRQINATGRSVRLKMEELERIEHYRREFLGNVSHELKTPIFSIRGFADTLLNGALNDESVRHSFVQKIQHNAARLDALAEDLAEVARIEMGELAMTIEQFSLRSVVNEVAESIEPLAARLKVIVRHTITDELPDVLGDRKRIRQVLSNLVDNAVKYSKPGGHVEIGARQLPTSQIKVSVVDNGIGVAPEHIGRLTERFFRVDTSRSRSLGGTGLGLAIVKHILGAHGSKLIVESHLHRGSTFGFSLPAATEQKRA